MPRSTSRATPPVRRSRWKRSDSACRCSNTRSVICARGARHHAREHDLAQLLEQRDRQPQRAVRDQQQQRNQQRLGRDVERVDQLLQHQRHADVGELGGDEERERDADAPAVAPDFRPQADGNRPGAMGLAGSIGGCRRSARTDGRTEDGGRVGQMPARALSSGFHPCRRAPDAPDSAACAGIRTRSGIAFAAPQVEPLTFEPQKAPQGARVFIVSPKDGATVGQDVHVEVRRQGHRDQAGTGGRRRTRPPPSADRQEGIAAARRADSERRDAQALRQGPDRGHDPSRAGHAYAAARFRRLPRIGSSIRRSCPRS